MPIDLADYGVVVFALGVVAWILTTIFGPKKDAAELSRIIADNTKATTALVGAIEKQGETLNAQGQVMSEVLKLIHDMRVDIAKKVG